MTTTTQTTRTANQPNRPYRCTDCISTFSTTEALKKHQTRHTPTIRIQVYEDETLTLEPSITDSIALTVGGAREVDCDHCGAEVNEPCVHPSGWRNWAGHSNRRKAADLAIYADDDSALAYLAMC